jgi:hypothetical protein
MGQASDHRTASGFGQGSTYAPSSPADRVVRAVLIAVFVVVTLRLAIPPLVVGLPFGWDAVVYTQAARGWLQNGNPWTSMGYAIGFAAPPPSLLPFVPFTPLPDQVVSVLWVGIALSSALYSLRRLALPAWWLLFPPVSLGIMTGSSALLVTALLLRGTPLTDGLAVVARIYAALPLLVLGRWRSLLVAGALLLATMLMPWGQYLDERARVAQLLEETSDLSAASSLWLVPLAVVGLILLGRWRSAWLIVPTLWPNTQLYYSVIALPVLGSMPLLALTMAVPVPGLIVVGILAEAVLERVRKRGAHQEATAVHSSQ